MHQPGSGLRRPDPALSPTLSDDSDSDISLGTHSPVPSSLSMQHSPGSASGGPHEDRLQDDKDYRPFSALNSFRFDAHSPAAMAGKLHNPLPTLAPSYLTSLFPTHLYVLNY